MGRKRSQRGHNSAVSGTAAQSNPVGTYDISTGTAEIEADPFRDGAFILHVNGVPSSHIVPGEPRELEFEYMRWIAAGVEVFASGHRITHLGGGACSLARYFADLWDDSKNTVVEFDAKLGELVREKFDIPRAPKVKIRAGEAREETEKFLPASRDIIIRDVFAGAVTPTPLTTVEFFQAAHRSLIAGGLYAANCGDHSDLRGAKAEIAGLLEVFNNVAVIADPPMLRGRRYGNIILIASDDELPAANQALNSRLLSGAVPAQYKGPAWTEKFASGAQPNRDPASEN
ncbi:spermidine synthase [Corynebacterium sp. L4756]|uniref:spermidine synthase n=1 Tax=unclassified Corynebacterium TaxID=2624378 RepID=UPI00374C8F60